MGILHAAQGAAVLALANGFTLPVTAAYLQGPPGTEPSDPTVLFDLSIAWAVSGFLFLSAAFHLVVITPPFRNRYLNGLVENRNYFRWVEYSLLEPRWAVAVFVADGGSDRSAHRNQ